jgi:mRNA interferase MazF
MTNCEFGDVVLVSFPFTDQSASKQRPAVVVSSAVYNRERHDFILMAVTGQVRGAVPFGEVEVRAWQRAGLLKPSVIKPILATIERGSSAESWARSMRPTPRRCGRRWVRFSAD